jgi:hypothetical protein
VVAGVNFTETTLDSFADSALTLANTKFTMTQIAYFGMRIQAAQRQITSRSVRPNSVCFQIGAGDCQGVEYSVIPSAFGMDPAFSVDFSASGNVNALESIVASPTQDHYYTVNAIVDVGFADSNGAVQPVSLSMTLDLSVEFPSAPSSHANTLTWFGINL